MSETNPSKFSEVRQCEHCSNRAPMKMVAQFDNVHAHAEDESHWAEGHVYELLLCPACESVVLRRYYWFDGFGAEDIGYEYLFPTEHGGPDGMPDVIAKAFMAARRVRSVDANAYGVLIGRLLDMVCTDRKAEGDSLAKRLEDLAKKGEIPDRLSKVASGLRRLRNVGAHADLGELTERDIPLLDDLSRAILEYVYSAPRLVEQAEQRLSKLTTQPRPDTPPTPDGSGSSPA